MVNEGIVKSQRRWSVSSFYLFLTESGKSHGLIVNIRLTDEFCCTGKYDKCNYLEKNLNKDTILELYLNTSYFGDGYYCVAEASRGYYKKEPKDMNRNEASMLAGIPNAPSAYCPTKHLDLAKKRQNQVLDKMVRYEFITAKEKEEILNESNAVEDNKD